MSFFYCSFILVLRTVYNKTVLFYFYFSFIKVVRTALRYSHASLPVILGKLLKLIMLC